MRHRKKNLKMNVQRDHRKAILRNLATSIILCENIKTTKAKAKQVQGLVESLITKAKTMDTMNAIRAINAVVFDEKASRKLLEELKPRYENRAGGYTRILKVGYRAGDAAEMVTISLV